MKYEVVIKKQAKKKLLSLSSNERVRITEKISQLGRDPMDKRLDIKKLVGQPYYRLRIGDWRVIFDKDDFIKIISIEFIKARGDVYK